MRGDSLFKQGEALSDLGEALEAAGQRDQAVAALREALERYELKPIIPLARRSRERLATLQSSPSPGTALPQPLAG